MKFSHHPCSDSLHAKIRSYYRIHSAFYDFTRWSFLFGRNTLIASLPSFFDKPPSRITEFGCGTGHNLLRLSRTFPTSSITGIDLSPDMLNRARSRCARRRNSPNISLILASDFQPLSEPQDLILFSYCLSMVNPGFEDILSSAISCLRPSGLMAVVDFHQSPLAFYRLFMKANHVSLTGQLYSSLLGLLHSDYNRISFPYFGAWSYFTFIGRPLQSQSV